MSITVETCGKAYCEHYPEGLPVCAKCREESTKAHDKACALLAEARADAEHWKSECNALQRMAHEARAEIEQLKQLWSCNLDIIGGELNKQLVEARADAEHWKSECSALQRMVHEARADIARKDGLIEQMRKALRLALPEARSTHVEWAIKIALKAERGEGTW